MASVGRALGSSHVLWMEALRIELVLFSADPFVLHVRVQAKDELLNNSIDINLPGALILESL